MTRSSRDLSNQPGVWLRPGLIGIDDASTSSPCGPSARRALGQLAISAPAEQWFGGKRSVYVLVRENLSSARRSVALARLELESARRRTALNGLELMVLDRADPSSGCEGTARSWRSPLGGREVTELVTKTVTASGRERTALKLGKLTAPYLMKPEESHESKATADRERRATAAAAWNRPQANQRCPESRASVDVGS